MSNRAGLPWFLSWCGINAAAALSALAAPAHAVDQSSGWFRYGSDVKAAWEIVADPTKPMEVRIRRKSADQLNPTKRVLVLYARPSPAYDIAITKILRVFDGKELDADFTVINYEDSDQRGREALRFAENNKFDLIFSMGSEPTAWLYGNYRGGALPVVSVCSKDPVLLGQMKDYDTGSGSNFAFTSLNVPVQFQMAYIMDLKPDLKNLAVLVDSKNISAVQTQAEPIAAAARQSGIQTLMVSVQEPTRAQEELAKLIPDAVDVMRKKDPDLRNSLFLITGSTSVFREIRTINEHAKQVPVVSMIPEIVTAGADTAVLGVGISFESNAHLAAIYGADVLQGRARPAELKVGVVSPPDIAISFLKARQIGMRVPFSFFETASIVYDYEGSPVRKIAHEIRIQN
jgi:putative ABC transport system substrate-binding protein